MHTLVLVNQNFYGGSPGLSILWQRSCVWTVKIGDMDCRDAPPITPITEKNTLPFSNVGLITKWAKKKKKDRFGQCSIWHVPSGGVIKANCTYSTIHAYLGNIPSLYPTLVYKLGQTKSNAFMPTHVTCAMHISSKMMCLSNCDGGHYISLNKNSGSNPFFKKTGQELKKSNCSFP